MWWLKVLSVAETIRSIAARHCGGARWRRLIGAASMFVRLKTILGRQTAAVPHAVRPWRSAVPPRLIRDLATRPVHGRRRPPSRHTPANVGYLLLPLHLPRTPVFCVFGVLQSLHLPVPPFPLAHDFCSGY